MIKWGIQQRASPDRQTARALAERPGLSSDTRLPPHKTTPTQPVETRMIYELRVYSCLPGRMAALQNRFQNHTLRIWEKHGIRQAGFWTTLIGPANNDLTYMIAWDSLADREARWNAFMADPEWIAARA